MIDSIETAQHEIGLENHYPRFPRRKLQGFYGRAGFELVARRRPNREQPETKNTENENPSQFISKPWSASKIDDPSLHPIADPGSIA